MTRLARNASANLVANAWSTLLALALTPVYVRLLGTESYGLIGFHASWVAILGIVDTGISATAVRQMAWLNARPADRSHLPVLLRTLEITYWIFILAAGICMFSAAAAFGAQWFQVNRIAPEAIRTTLMLMAVALTAQMPTGLYVAGLMGLQHQVSTAALVTAFGTIRGIGALCVLLVWPDIRAFFVWQIAASVLQTVSVRRALWRYVAVAGPAAFSFNTLRSMQRFAGGMTVITALSVIITQADKIMLTRLVPLEVVGVYMLAWTAASGFSRISTPLIQAFGPRFTELIAQNDEKELRRHVRRASGILSALIIPPSVVLMFNAEAALIAWTNVPEVAAGAAPLLAVLVAGTALSSLSYPALSVLYSRGHLRPVIVMNVIAVAVFVPLLAFSIHRFGAVGAAACWALYGGSAYVAYVTAARADVMSSIARDIIAPALISMAAAVPASYLIAPIAGAAEIVVVLAVSVVIACALAVLISRDLRHIFVDYVKWKPAIIH